MIFSSMEQHGIWNMNNQIIFFQGQYFSGGIFRIYLLGNPIIWWSNLVFLALFLLTYFIAAIKQQRGYDVNEELEVKGMYCSTFPPIHSVHSHHVQKHLFYIHVWLFLLMHIHHAHFFFAIYIVHIEREDEKNGLKVCWMSLLWLTMFVCLFSEKSSSKWYLTLLHMLKRFIRLMRLEWKSRGESSFVLKVK